ncbi:MAG: GPW/gp25 family protein [Calditrichaeota bacterium]|jgi:phage baseplate assembly protein W|nr:GPW/gp25 family protein [Calditrichota bacterium]MBT7789862.1 GPW/gp25 family protein [Calditrichota bacterium]
MREDYLGMDILFDLDGDLAVGLTGDLLCVSGRDCLLQDVRDRLETLPGDLFAHGSWGCGIGKLLGAPDTPLNRALATRYIRYALEAEPRIEDKSISIKPLVFNTEEKRFEINFSPVNGINPASVIWGFGVTDILDVE